MPKTIDLDPARIPEHARRFAAPCELKAGDQADSVAVHILARSPEPLDHWYWGLCVHDLDGMQKHKEKLALDYVHDDEQILGYLDTFEHRDGGLWADGKLLLTSERAKQIYSDHQNGVPYEASIAFGMDGLVTEFVHANATAVVNGREMAGPLLVFRQWNLRGVAICPHGYDKHTLTEFCAANPNLARFTPPEDATVDGAEDPDAVSGAAADDLTDPPPAAEAATDEPAPEAEIVDDPPNPETPDLEATAETPDPEAPAETPAADPAAQRAAEGAVFVAEFGEDRGPRYFTAGLTLEAARAEYTRDLAEENAALRSRLEAIGDRLGDVEPVEFQDGEPGQAKTASGRDAKQLRNSLPERLANFALGLRFAGKN